MGIGNVEVVASPSVFSVRAKILESTDGVN